MEITPLTAERRARRVRAAVQHGLDARVRPISPEPRQHCRYCGDLTAGARTVEHIGRDITAVDRARQILARDFGEGSPYADRALADLRRELDTAVDAALAQAGANR